MADPAKPRPTGTVEGDRQTEAAIGNGANGSQPRRSPSRALERVLVEARRLDRLSLEVLCYCLAFAVLRVWAVLGHTAVRTHDSAGYFAISFSGDATRLWTVPLLYRSLPSDSARVLAQMAIGVVCWSALALVVAHSLRHRILARVGAASVLLLGLCVQVTEWDVLILSESLALSLTALLLAAILWWRRRRTTPALVGALVVLTLWVFTRELQAAVYLPICAVVIVWVLLRARRYVWVAAVLAALGAWSGYAANGNNDILADNAHNLLVLRILQEPDGVSFFARRGLPDLEILRREATTRQFTGRRSVVLKDPVWTKWIEDHWIPTYSAWLIRHPVATIRRPFGNLSTDLSGFPSYASIRRVLPSPIQDAFWDRSAGDLPFSLVVAVGLWLASLRLPRRDDLDLWAVGIILSAVLWYFIAWHLTVAQLGRICVPIGAALRVGIVLLALAALERILRRNDPVAPRRSSRSKRASSRVAAG
jgi:hypothetical protein